MEIRKTLYVTSREEWRAWLTKHYLAETEVWLIYYKKHTGRPRISYDEAVEEALCFGWIDSIGKRMDDEKFVQKFTPRRDRTNWSALNKRRLRTLIREGRMTGAGLATIDLAMLGEEAQANRSKGDQDIPRFVEQALMTHTKAWENFRNLTPSRRRAYLRLIMDAKREDTRERRLGEAISLLEQSRGELQDIPRFVKQAIMASPKAWAYSNAWRRPTASTTSGGSCTPRKRRRASGGCAKPSRSWSKARNLALNSRRRRTRDGVEVPPFARRVRHVGGRSLLDRSHLWRDSSWAYWRAASERVPDEAGARFCIHAHVRRRTNAPW